MNVPACPYRPHLRFLEWDLILFFWGRGRLLQGTPPIPAGGASECSKGRRPAVTRKRSCSCFLKSGTTNRAEPKTRGRSVHPWAPAGAVLSHVHLEILLGALQLVVAVPAAHLVHIQLRETHFQVKQAENHPAQVRDVADAAVDV